MGWLGNGFSNVPGRRTSLFFVSALLAGFVWMLVPTRARLSLSHIPRQAAPAPSTQTQPDSDLNQPTSPGFPGFSISSDAPLRRGMKRLRSTRGIRAPKTRPEGTHAAVPRRDRMMYRWIREISQPDGRAPPRGVPLVSAISLSFQNEVPDGPSDGREKVWWILSDLQIGTDTPSFGTVPVDGRIAKATGVGQDWVGAAGRNRIAPMRVRFASLQFLHGVASLSRTDPTNTRIRSWQFGGRKPAAIRVCQTESFAQGSAIT